MKKKKELKDITIKAEIQKVVILLLSISLLLVGILSCWLNYRSTMRTVKDAIIKTAEVSAEQIQYRLKSLMNVVEVIGTMKHLSSYYISLEEKRSILDEQMTAYNLRSSRIIDTKGISIFDPDKDLSDREYFKRAMKGEVAISDPIFSSTNGELIITIAAPVWKEGVRNTQIVGVVMVTLDATSLSDIVGHIQISKNAEAYLINNMGTSIAHSNYSMVEEENNTIEKSKTDSKLLGIAKLESKMIAGESSVGYYTYDGQPRILAYAPIKEMNGWSLGISAPLLDFMSGTIQSVWVTILLLIIALAFSFLFVRRLAIGIGVPVHQCTERIMALSKGDLKSALPTIETRNETRILVKETQEHLNSLNTILGDLDYRLDEIADGNFTVTSEVEERYVGDFKNLSISVNEICIKLNATLSQINEVSKQVFFGAEQVSSGAQVLSQGTIQQANSIEMLSSTVIEISQQVKKNAQNTQIATSLSEESEALVTEGNEQMQDMIIAMNNISETSEKIGKIIKTIDDIAYQTNILALNAAVEAAHAGEAGKGFVVVAHEIRNLAQKSAEAVKTTTELIKDAVSAVNTGTEIASKTAASLTSIVQKVEDINEYINDIACATKQQASSIEQVTNGVEEISAVVQTNSATAQQSASASQELSAQSQMLRSLIEEFQLQ